LEPGSLAEPPLTQVHTVGSAPIVHAHGKEARGIWSSHLVCSFPGERCLLMHMVEG
jgi:hypothetical protein